MVAVGRTGDSDANGDVLRWVRAMRDFYRLGLCERRSDETQQDERERRG